MKKNGFVFIETIISILVLSTALLLIYSSFNKILQSEKSRIYYDDANYIFRTWNILNELKTLNLTGELNAMSASNKAIITVGLESTILFQNHEDQIGYYSNYFNNFEINRLSIVKASEIVNLKKCTPSRAVDATSLSYNLCHDYYIKLSSGMINYLKTIYYDTPTAYILIAEYKICNDSQNSCRYLYGWVSV